MIINQLNYVNDNAIIADIRIAQIGRTTYHEGESFSLEGYQIMAIHTDLSEQDITNQCTFSPSRSLTFEDTEIIISYGERNLTQVILVANEQVINYTMLYDNGNECTDVTGGWNLHTNGYGTLTRNTSNVYFNSTGNGVCMKTAKQINMSGYNGWLVISKNYTYGGTPGQNAIWCTTSTNTSGYPDYDTMIVPTVTSSYNNMKDEGNKKPTFWYAFYKTSTSSGYIKKCWRGNYHTGNLIAIAMTKPDNWQELATIGGIEAASIDDIITESGTLLNNQDAIYYMIFNCTGDFMAAAVQSEVFLTALNNSPYKTQVYANEHWAKFLAMAA